MGRPATDWADDVASRARGVLLYAQRMDRLFSQGAIPRTDIERAYAGSFLSFYAYLEQSIGRLFVGLLTGGYVSGDSAVRPLVSVDSRVVAYAIIRGERRYVNWLPYNRYALRRSKAFFSSGRPFANLAKSEVAALDRMTTIRNALAHESYAARRSFRRAFTDNKALPPDQLRPAGYLRGLHAVGQTRLDLTLSHAVRSTRVLAK